MINNTKCVFYFAYFGTDTDDESIIISRAKYINEQLLFLSNLCDENNINLKFIVATIPERFSGMLLKIAKECNFLIYSKYISDLNNYEYNGISACIEFAEQGPEALIFYCHSKGSVNKNELSMGIFKYHCEYNLRWDTDQLKLSDEIYKAGLFPSEHGWLWHNFFWVKSSYLRDKKLQPDGTRHYYEAFIGEKNNKQAHKNVISTLPEHFFNAQETLRKNCFYEANDINKCGFLNREFRRLGKKNNKDLQ
ncbi:MULTISPECIES: hypothetical protein [Enterobacteriaceae]|uniref:hypothetical protein n=1 Tax=Enterobacteriaceae TaxID=543 RepID=UPI0023B26110|nr:MULTISPECIES: hypothetical protein [Citrobacter]MDE9681324.1 hypothetical protein [Citrobacter portucalensis]MDM2780809.1 hypothetical protein [Citrobacter sp. Cpo137]MED8618625.1 hypothetical protein [Escherichia coli]